MDKGEIVTEEYARKENINEYVRSLTQELRRLNAIGGRSSVTFASYSKDDILDYLRTPETNSAKLVEVSQKMYQSSPQYRRLIQYHAGLPTWAYVIEPVAYTPSKVKHETIEKQYYKTAAYVEKMSIRHEMQKALHVAFRDGIFYGVIRSTADTWFIQRIDPKICTPSSIIDGCWVFSVNMSRIKEADLYMYPDEFADMYAEYKRTGDKWQEVPNKVCFCLKADETVDYVVPPFASVLPSIIELESYRELAKIAKEVGNYKLLAMRVPLNDNGELSLPWDQVLQFYQHLCNALPDYVGAAAVPMELDDIDFRESNANNTSDLEEAIRSFWYSTNTSPLLFGDATNNTATALRMSIRTDEELVFTVMAQCERLINHHLKKIGGSVKFRVNLLQVTVFNQEQMTGFYKEASTLGLPAKTAYASTIGLHTPSIQGLCYLENEILKYPEIFIPMQTSYTQSSEGGRPQASDDELGDAGDATRGSDANANREG